MRVKQRERERERECETEVTIRIILVTTLYFSFLQEVRTADDMEKNGANGTEAGATDWQKGNPQLSALLSQQAPAVVINGAGAVVSSKNCTKVRKESCLPYRVGHPLGLLG